MSCNDCREGESNLALLHFVNCQSAAAAQVSFFKVFQTIQIAGFGSLHSSQSLLIPPHTNDRQLPLPAAATTRLLC